MTRRVLLVPLLAACDPGAQACEDAAAIPGVLDVGTGESAFEPIADGDEVQVSWGSQGGKHVYGSLRAEGLLLPVVRLSADDDPLVDFALAYADGTVITGYGGLPRTFQQEGDAAVFTGEILQLDWREEGHDGLEVVMSARVEDGCGRVLEGEKRFTLFDPQ